MRIRHDKYGLGVILEEFVSGGGSKVARVIFDFNPDEERTILRSALSDSQTPLPEVAKAKTRKPRAKKVPTPEPIGDELLVELSRQPVPAIQLDPVDVDELPDELKNEPQVTDECVESYTETV